MNTPRFKLSMSALIVASTLALTACEAEVAIDSPIQHRPRSPLQNKMPMHLLPKPSKS
ncbi:hypothetical protein P4S68_19310 [Pseudoalteromonas sp. Hal099]